MLWGPGCNGILRSRAGPGDPDRRDLLDNRARPSLGEIDPDLQNLQIGEWVSMSPTPSERAGVATSTLRYYEELGLLPTAARIAGQRRYPESAAGPVGVILLLRDAGFSPAEQKALMASRAAAPGDWQRLARPKLAELDDQIAKAQTAREAIDHALRCPYDDILECPNFARVVAARLTGQPLHQAHPHQPLHTTPDARPRADLRLQHSGEDRR